MRKHLKKMLRHLKRLEFEKRQLWLYFHTNIIFREDLFRLVELQKKITGIFLKGKIWDVRQFSKKKVNLRNPQVTNLKFT